MALLVSVWMGAAKLTLKVSVAAAWPRHLPADKLLCANVSASASLRGRDAHMHPLRRSDAYQSLAGCPQRAAKLQLASPPSRVIHASVQASDMPAVQRPKRRPAQDPGQESRLTCVKE